MDPKLIPGFIRMLANSLQLDSEMDCSHVNDRLHYLGWREFDLDDHTLQLAITCFENDGFDTGDPPDSGFDNPRQRAYAGVERRWRPDRRSGKERRSTPLEPFGPLIHMCQ